MSRKSQCQESFESQLVTWYKWEFLRRNVEYCRDYESFTREFGDWFRKHGYWYEEKGEPWGKRNLLFFAQKIAPRAKILCKRWQIRDPVSPTTTFEKPRPEDEHHNEFLLPTNCSEQKAGAEWDLADLAADYQLSEEEFRNKLPDSTAKAYGPDPDYYLEMVFDLRVPLESLLRLAENRITSRKHFYDRRHPKPTKVQPTVRRRFDLYDQYLQVWDLRSQGGKFETIGAILFGDKPRRAQHASDSFSRAQELVGGGYKELR